MALISQLPSSMFQDIAIWMYKDLVTKVRDTTASERVRACMRACVYVC